MTRQDFELCPQCGNAPASDEHHLYRRGSHPDKVNEPRNKIKICRKCHTRTEEEPEFYEAMQEIFYKWRPANLDIFLRAQASIDALLNGKEIEYLTPAMTSHYLNLAGASYSQFSERLAECEKEFAPFFMARTETMNNKAIEMEWKCTERGQEMITAKIKLKALEKLQSNLRANLRRLEVERYNSR